MSKLPEITFSKKTTPLNVLADGEIVGSIRRSARSHLKFLLELDGVYWRDSKPRLVSGSTAIGLPTLHESKCLANSTLNSLWGEIQQKRIKGMSDSAQAGGGNTPLNKMVAELDKKVDRYLVVSDGTSGIKNFGFFDATCAEDARHMARGVWHTTNYLSVYHPEHYNEHNWTYHL